MANLFRSDLHRQHCRRFEQQKIFDWRHRFSLITVDDILENESSEDDDESLEEIGHDLHERLLLRRFVVHVESLVLELELAGFYKRFQSLFSFFRLLTDYHLATVGKILKRSKDEQI